MRKVTYCVVKAYLLCLKRQAFTMHWISMCYNGDAKPWKERAATRGKAGAGVSLLPRQGRTLHLI